MDLEGCSMLKPSAGTMESEDDPVTVPLPQCDYDYFPYGCANFKKMRMHGKYWKDNSRHIAETVEKKEQHQIFRRPP